MAEHFVEGDAKPNPDIDILSVTPNVTTKIKGSLQILDRFCGGYLVGKIVPPEIKIYDIVKLDIGLFENVDFAMPLSDCIVAEFASIRASYPVGIDVIGVFTTQPENGNLEVEAHLMSILGHLEDICHAEFYVTCLIKPSSLTWQLRFGEGDVETLDNIGECDDQFSESPLFRIHQEININWLKSTGDEGLQMEIDRLDKEFIGHKPAYLIKDSGVVIYNDDNGLTLPEISCSGIIDDLKSTLGIKKWPAEKKPFSNVIDVTALTRMSAVGDIAVIADPAEEEDVEKAPFNAPVLLSNKLIGERVAIKLRIDAFVSACLETPAHKLLYMMRDAVFRQWSALSLLLKINPSKFVFAPFHFPSLCGNVPLTVMLPSLDIKGEEVEEEMYKEHRKCLHDRFLLPDDRIIFHKILCLFSSRPYGTTHILNPHEGLKEPHVEGGEVAIVAGKYAYHHYFQDNIDDNHWGCAYRSLQTLASWFWLQGYTQKTYPSHREIQEALVAIGDKENSFIGSKEWIGSVEVSFSLNELFGVTSKTLHCSTGADLAYKGRELYRHFVDEGTPIMIGGGVLAHTIVGVKYNEYTGAIKFLIVDPHFTGKDQLKTIQSKGWVGWKGPAFWNQTAHYNLCMPLRPRSI